MEQADVVVVGAGAAGLMAAIEAARSGPGLRIVLVDGARRPGAKILVAGGGRCNVTHERVTAEDYAGSTPPAIRKVLRAFDVPQTIAFFREIGVELKREETGKLFPTTNRARTVLEALLDAARRAGVELRHPWRVASIEPREAGLRVIGPEAEGIACRRVILATGGQSVPKTGSDGHGYRMAEALGHTLTPLVLPALVPLLLPTDHPMTRLRGLSTPVRVTVRQGDRVLATVEGPLLLTHFGVSGPAILDASRHLLHARAADATASLTVSWLPETTPEVVERRLMDLGPASLLLALAPPLPRRLAEALIRLAGEDPDTRGDQLARGARRRLVEVLTTQVLPVTDSRGWDYAEVTAGGVPLREVDLRTMASRRTPGLHLCGEILDVDGRIGGFNFQWAWASGHLAGRGAASACERSGK